MSQTTRRESAISLLHLLSITSCGQQLQLYVSHTQQDSRQSKAQKFYGMAWSDRPY